MARTHLKLDYLDSALEYAQKSLKLSQELNKLDLQGDVLNTLGLIYHKKNDLREAHHYFQGALARLQTISSKQLEAETFFNIGGLYLEQKEFEQALYYCQKALGSAKAIESKTSIRDSHLLLAKVYKGLKNYQKALSHQESYNEIDKSIFNEKADMKLKSLQILHETESAKQQTEIYRLQNVELKDTQLKLQQRMQELETLKQKLQEISIRDGLTNIYNRRYLDEQLSILFSRANRYNQSLSLAIIDVDNFKKINDTFSHQIGDEILKFVANILVSDLRESDLAGRYGGEEFVLLLPETSLNQARIVCERKRHKIANYDWSFISPELRVTVSIGIADKVNIKSYQEQLQIADERLYIAKRSGKNQVVTKS